MYGRPAISLFCIRFIKKSNFRKMKTIVLIIAAGLTYSVAEAQSLTPQVFNTTGGTYKKGYYALDWSIGEVPLVEQYKPSGETYIITNGYLQSFTDSQKPSYVPGVFGRDDKQERLKDSRLRGNDGMGRGCVGLQIPARGRDDSK